MAAPKNLGRVWSKVILYDSLPNIVIDPQKLRQSCNFILSVENDTSVSKDSFGMQYLGVPSTAEQPSGGNVGDYQSGGMIPQVCYEPLNNWMLTKSAATVAGNIYWSSLPGTGAAGIPPAFKRIVLSGIGTKIAADTPLPEISAKQSWTDEEQNVQSTAYQESFYLNSGLGFDTTKPGTPTMSPVVLAPTPTAPTTPPTPAPTPPVDVTPPAPQTKRFVHQLETGVGVWWGAKTSSDYKAYGCPFWVTVRAKPGYTPSEDTNDTSKSSYIGILITRDDRTVADAKESPDNEYMLIISNRGETYVTYAVDGKTVNVNVDLPNLSEAFQNGTEFRVGFLIVCGRLCVFCNSNTYSFVDVLGKSNIGIGLNLKTRCGEIYGYGCSAYVNFSPMTFYKKCWYIPELDGALHYEGNRSPEIDTGGVTAGTWADGALISWDIPQDQYAAANNRRMYAAQFAFYLEKDFVDYSLPTTSIGIPATPATATTPASLGSKTHDQEYTTQNCARNWWGNIYVVRATPVVGLAVKPFWFCYMETGDVTDLTGTVSNPITNIGSGFPILYNLFSTKKDPVPTSLPPYSPSLGSYDISNHVMSMQISEELDNVKPSAIIKKASIVVYDPEDVIDYTVYLTRARGVKIWLMWSVSETNPIDITIDAPIFVGVAFGETSSLSPGKDTLSFSCFDYWHVLGRMKIKNSPFYDGYELTSVIRDLAERAGVYVYDRVVHGGAVPFHFLGSGFSFDKPMHKYEAQMSIKDCMIKAVQFFPYYMFFDYNGVLTIAIVPGDFDWSQTAPDWDPDVYKTYYREFNSAITDTTPEKLILNEITMTSTLSSSLYNSIFVKGTNRTTNELVLSTDPNRASLLTPDSVGYLGFIAEIEISQPALADESAVNAFKQRVMKMYSVPGFETNITTIGHNTNYICGQFIKIKHNQEFPETSKKFRVSAINHTYDATKNEWLTKITAYQITPGKLGTTATPTPTPTP